MVHHLSDRLVADAEASLGEQILNVAKAQVETKIQPHGVSDDLGLYVMMDWPGGLAHDLGAQLGLWLVPEGPPARYSGPLGVM